MKSQVLWSLWTSDKGIILLLELFILEIGLIN